MIEVTLRRYPVASAVSRNPATVLGVVGLLVAASFIYWRRPRDPAALAVLVTASAVTAGVTAYPLGTGAIDLAGGRGVWPQAGGEVAWAVGAAAALAAALTFPFVRRRLREQSLGVGGGARRAARRHPRLGAARRLASGGAHRAGCRPFSRWVCRRCW